MEIRRAGAHALLLDLGEPALVEGWRAELWRRRAAGEFTATEIVPGARTVLLDEVGDPVALAREIRGWPPPAAAGSGGGELVEIPVRYDGPDLESVADLWRVDPDTVVARHLGAEFRVAFCGFAPGFAYMTGLPAALAVPRLPSPRPRVPPGSVGLADVYCGIYPNASPGGWRLIGRTDAVLFDPARPDPALLTPGTRVRFVTSGNGT
jgi:KipI family sensor histidine kinase inhibitor